MSVALLHFIHSPQYHFSQMIAKKNTLYSFFKAKLFNVKFMPLPPPPFRNSHRHMEMIGFEPPVNCVEKNESSNWSAKKIPR